MVHAGGWRAVDCVSRCVWMWYWARNPSVSDQARVVVGGRRFAAGSLRRDLLGRLVVWIALARSSIVLYTRVNQLHK